MYVISEECLREEYYMCKKLLIHLKSQIVALTRKSTIVFLRCIDSDSIRCVLGSCLSRPISIRWLSKELLLCNNLNAQCLALFSFLSSLLSRFKAYKLRLALLMLSLP